MNDFTVDLPQIFENRVTLSEMGGIADGVTSNTQIFQNAIEKLSKMGGGHLVVPAGIWLTGPICLKSGIDLHLEEGSIILFDKNQEEYPLRIVNYEGQKRIRACSPLYAEHETDISVTGSGVIDGNGHLWRMAKEFKFTPREWKAKTASSPKTFFETEEGQVWFPTESAFAGAKRGEPDLEGTDKAKEEEILSQERFYYDYYRPVLVSFVDCERVLLKGVRFQNSPAWNIHPLFCRHFTMDQVYVHNEASAQNGDGLDLESCKFAEITNCIFDVGDDAICMKSGKNAPARKIAIPTEYVRISGCKVIRGHGGFVIGSEMSRGVRNVTVENCTFIGTDIGLRFKSAMGRGGVVENITVKNIQMLRIPAEAIIFTMGYQLYQLPGENTEKDRKTDPEDIPVFQNIEISGITACGAAIGLRVEGLGNHTIHDIAIKNSLLQADKTYEVSGAERIWLENVWFVGKGKQKIYYEKIDCGEME